MGLAERLQAIHNKPAESGCRTCKFYMGIEPADREGFDEWVAGGGALTVLRKECERDGLKVSDRAFRDHINNHHKMGKVGQ